MSLDTFNPVKLSLEENEFLLKHLGEPSTVALREIKAVPMSNPPRDGKTGRLLDKNPVHYPDGVIPASVKPILDRVYELLDLEAKFGEKWVGVDAIKACIQAYLDQQKKWQADKKRFPNAPRFPSMHSFDAKGRPHRGGPGSDCGEVRTYFDKSGTRHSFSMDLLEYRETGGWSPEWLEKPEAPSEAPKFNVEQAARALVNDANNNRIECPICKHTESYKPDSRPSYTAARARMSKHLRNDKREQALHRELYTNEFGA